MALQVSEFVEYINNTREMRPVKPSEFIDQAERRTMIMPKILSLPEKDLTDGGEPMKWKLYGRTGNRGGNIVFGQQRTFGRTTGTVEASILHRQTENSESWLQPEIDYQQGPTDTTWLQMEDLIYNALDGNHLELLEDQFLAPPSSYMESTARGAYPMMSLPCLIPPTATGAPAGTWSAGTIMGVNYTNYSWWKPQWQTYSRANPYDPVSGLINTLEKLVRRMSWVNKMQNASADRVKWKATVLDKMMGITGEYGADLYNAAMQYRNDSTPSRTDPSIPGALAIKGIPILGIQRIDELNLDHSTSTAYTQPYAADNPPFWFIDTAHVKMKFHPLYRLKEKVLTGDMQNWDKAATVRLSSGNTWCDSRQRCGVSTAA